MLTCLFWNFNCALPEKESIVAQVALHHSVDVLLLTEMKTDPWHVLEQLRSGEQSSNIPPDLENGIRVENPIRFQIFTRLPDGQFCLHRETNRTSLWCIRRPGHAEVLLALIHFYSKTSYPGRDPVEGQHEDSGYESQAVREAEDARGHMRTILVGDFNMNPFERGMIDAECGFGAMMCRELAMRDCTGTTADSKPRHFSNPTWSRMGLDFPAPPGTFSRDNVADHLNIDWHTLDQLLMRSALLDSFQDEDLEILCKTPENEGETFDLIRSKPKHWEIKLSDHLPLLFRFALPQEEPT